MAGCGAGKAAITTRRAVLGMLESTVVVDEEAEEEAVVVKEVSFSSSGARLSDGMRDTRGPKLGWRC
jgi:hypothetical protein